MKNLSLCAWTEKREWPTWSAVSVTNGIRVKLTVRGYHRRSNSLTDLGLHSDLTEPIDIYSEWIDAADAAQREEPPRRPVASSSRAARAPAYDSDDE
jgi:hypothetical protein